MQNDHYAGLYRQWAKPIYFLVGKQWLVWDPRIVNFVLDTDVPEWRQQPVTNYTYAVYRAAMAKLTKQKPTLECVPPSGDSEDRDAAQLSEALLEFLWRYLKKPSKVIRAIGWILCTGKVFLDSGWDPEAGEVKPRTVLVEVPNPDAAAAVEAPTIDVDCPCDEEGEPYRRKPATPGEAALDGGEPYDLEREPEVEPEGEISFDVVDPMSVRHDPGCVDPNQATEWFRATLLPAELCAKLYDCEVNDLMSKGPHDDEGDNRSDIENFLSSVTAAPPDPFNQPVQRLGSSQEEALGDRVLHLEYYRKASASEGFPEGRFWITCGGKKVWPKQDDPEYPDGEAPLPFGFWPPQVPIIDTPIPGQPDGIALLSQVVPLNEQINYDDGKIGEYHTMMAMGGVIWAAPADRGITVTSEPGQVKVSKAYGETGRHPIREKLNALPGEVYRERNEKVNKLRSIAGLSEVDMAQRPEGVTAGRAFLVLQEASDAPFMPLLTALEDGLCEIGRRELVIARAMYTEERTIKIRGSKGQYEFRSFAGADLRDGVDVRVQSGSMYPWSKSAQWDTKLSLVQAMPGLVTNPATGEVDEAKLARLLDSGVPGLKAFESQEDPDLIEIDREHAMFEAFDPTDPTKSNQLPQLGFWQNLAVHQREHYDFLKRDYARFQRWSPAAREAFMEHCRLTTEAIDQLAESMLPPEPSPSGDDANVTESEESGGSEPIPNGKRVALVPPGGTQGRKQTPTASRKESQTQLTRADRRAANQ